MRQPIVGLPAHEDALLAQIELALEQRPAPRLLSTESASLFSAWEVSRTIGELERGWSTLVAQKLIDHTCEPLWYSKLGEEPRVFYVRRWRELRDRRR